MQRRQIPIRAAAHAATLAALAALAATVSTVSCRLSYDAATVDDSGPPDSITTPWLDAAFSHRKPIELQTTREALQDYPALIELTNDVDLAANANVSGSDFVFTEADGLTVIAHEIESWQDSSGSLTAWVRIRSLSVTEATTVFIYYGNPSAIDSSAPASVWTDIVAAAWHLNTEPLVVDSGPGGLNGTPVNGPSRVDANVGHGLSFDGTSRVDFATPDSLRFGDDSFSFSVWVFVTASQGEFDMPFFFGGASPLRAGYDFELGADEWVANVGDGTSTQAATLGVESSFLGRWVHLVAVVDREMGEFVAYADGLRKGTEALTIGEVLPTQSATIGAADDGDFAFSGVVDEMRIYPRALTAEWIAAVHANLSNPGTFLSIGPQESLPAN